MTEKEKQRGLELQGYIDSIRDMTIKEIAIKYLKKHHFPKFLAGLLVKFSYPLLLAKGYELTELEAQIEKMKCCENCQTVRDVNGNCYLHKDGECDPKTKIKWEMKQ